MKNETFYRRYPRMAADYFTAEDVISKDAEITPGAQRTQRVFVFFAFG